MDLLVWIGLGALLGLGILDHTIGMLRPARVERTPPAEPERPRVRPIVRR